MLNGVFRFTKTNNFNIVSTTLYETHYTFFFIASQEVGKKGRLFSSNIDRLIDYLVIGMIKAVLFGLI